MPSLKRRSITASKKPRTRSRPSKVFKTINVKPEGVKFGATDGLLKEAEDLIQEGKGVALYTGMLAACEAVEHYEIPRYGSLREWAKLWGNEEAHVFPNEILEQEKLQTASLRTSQ